MKPKSFCMAKYTVINKAADYIVRVFVLTNYIPDIGLISKIYKEVKNWTSRKQIILLK